MKNEEQFTAFKFHFRPKVQFTPVTAQICSPPCPLRRPPPARPNADMALCMNAARPAIADACPATVALLLLHNHAPELPLAHSLAFPSLLSLRPRAGARASARQPWPPRPNSLAAAAPSPEASCSRAQQRESRERLPTPSSGQQDAGKHRRRSNSRSSHLSPWAGHYGLPRAGLSSPTRVRRLPGAPPPLPGRRHGPQRPEP